MKALLSEPTEFGSILTKVEVESYEDYSKLLKCKYFDVVRVKWNGVDISLFVDDEGMLKGGNLGRIVDGYPNPLFGSIVVTGGTDSLGETLPIPSEVNMIDISNRIGEVEFIIKG